ncbi:MAG TPA: GNAT family N-acetyltransferase [bacterium]|nr:GNAT family N-acetyltransferase [bacterium]
MAQIRRVVEHDFEPVHRLLEQLMPALPDLRQHIWGRMLARQDYAAWIAEIEDRPAGFIDLYVFPDIGHGRNIALINNLVVDEAFRRRGLGEALVNEAVAHCRTHDVIELHLWTEFDNTRALALYERCGFVRRSLLMELGL